MRELSIHRDGKGKGGRKGWGWGNLRVKTEMMSFQRLFSFIRVQNPRITKREQVHQIFSKSASELFLFFYQKRSAVIVWIQKIWVIVHRVQHLMLNLKQNMDAPYHRIP